MSFPGIYKNNYYCKDVDLLRCTHTRGQGSHLNGYSCHISGMLTVIWKIEKNTVLLLKNIYPIVMNNTPHNVFDFFNTIFREEAKLM